MSNNIAQLRVPSRGMKPVPEECVEKTPEVKNSVKPKTSKKIVLISIISGIVCIAVFGTVALKITHATDTKKLSKERELPISSHNDDTHSFKLQSDGFNQQHINKLSIQQTQKIPSFPEATAKQNSPTLKENLPIQQSEKILSLPEDSSKQSNLKLSDSPDATLELELGKQVYDLNEKLKNLESRINDLDNHINNEFNINSGKIDGRIDELQHRIDIMDKTLLNDFHNQNSLQLKNQSLPKNERKANVYHNVKKTVTPKKPNYHVTAAAGNVALIAIPGSSQDSMIRVTVGSVINGWGVVKRIDANGPLNSDIVTEQGIIK